MKRLLPWIVLLVPAFALAELSAHAMIRSRVASPGDWQRASEYVRGQLQPRDLIVAAPAWSDPLLRAVLGDRIDLAMAGRADAAAYERLWALSIRGARPPEAPARAPEVSRRFGQVRVLRWDLGASPVVADLVARLPSARVRLGKRDCRWEQPGVAGGGGLGLGTLAPAERFVCGRRPWQFVAPVVLEDLDLQPRYCIWQQPSAGRPVSVRFDDVPLGERLVVYASLYYEDERMRRGAPVQLAVQLDGAPLGSLVHRDGDGLARLALPIPEGRRGGSGSLTFETSASQPSRRSLCWSATTRSGEPRP